MIMERRNMLQVSEVSQHFRYVQHQPDDQPDVLELAARPRHDATEISLESCRDTYPPLRMTSLLGCSPPNMAPVRAFVAMGWACCCY